MKTRYAVLVATMMLAGLSLLAPLRASAQAPGDRWTYSLMPYLWLPTVKGTINYGPPPSGGNSANVDVDSGSYLHKLDFAFMINGEARKDRWLIATDIIYLDFSGNDSSVKSVDFNPGPGPINISTTSLNTGGQSKLTGWLWTAVGGYAAIREPRANLDVIGGFRLLDLTAKTDWQLTASVTGPGGTTPFARSGSVEQSESVWAGIVGAKGRVKLGEGKWFANYYVDAGGASSLFTWQGAIGVGYAYKWGELLLDYRYLSYNQGGDNLIDDLSFGGLAFGANFRF